MRRAGQHYPGTYGAMRAWFPDDAACLGYLDWLPGVVLSYPRGRALSRGAWCFHQRAVSGGRWKRWSVTPLFRGHQMDTPLLLKGSQRNRLPG
jgi:hypothetical protein